MVESASVSDASEGSTAESRAAAAATGTAERRVWVRFESEAIDSRATSPNGPAGWWATVVDISAGGIGLSAQRPLEVGTSLALRLSALLGQRALAPLARIVHVTSGPNDQWLLGCEFTRPLSRAELQELLATLQ